MGRQPVHVPSGLSISPPAEGAETAIRRAASLPPSRPPTFDLRLLFRLVGEVDVRTDPDAGCVHKGTAVYDDVERLSGRVQLAERPCLGVEWGLAKEVLDSGHARRVVRLVGPSAVTGLSALVGEAHPHTAVVIGAGLACRIPVATLGQWAGRDPRSSARLGRLWQQALDDADQLIVAYGCGPAAARLACFVLFLTETMGPGAQLCRREAAELLGVTPVSVTRLVGELKRRGLIREQGASLAAWDEPGLRTLAAQIEPISAVGRVNEALPPAMR